MFNSDETVVEKFEAIEIAPELISIIGKSIAEACGLSYVEKGDKSYIMKGGLIPFEITPSSLKELIEERIQGKSYEKLSVSPLYKLVVELSLINVISFRRPTKSVRELIQ